MELREIPCKTILNPTGGFLGQGFTHTINLYRGCALGNTLCGLYCYAQWNPYHVRGRTWGRFLDVKEGAVQAYCAQYDRLKSPGEPKPIRIFMSSVTEPYPPQERTLRRTRKLLEAMVERPPDLLAIQSHTPLVVEDLSLLRELQQQCDVRIHVTVETDKPNLPASFPKQAYSPRSRIQALHALRAAGLDAVATVSPLLPLDDPERFANELEQACTRVILDHYLLGDGSSEGQRTNRTSFPRLLREAGYAEWTTLKKFHEIVDVFRTAFGGPERVGVSREGFNAGGNKVYDLKQVVSGGIRP
ncbi:MAG: radical SAM protein [Nitrospira sp. SB0677_bin_15]|nr:radical SAM protein [Nitrospira sp. SB0677_bin_15]